MAHFDTVLQRRRQSPDQQRIDQLAGQLAASGASHIGIWLDNGPDWLLIQLAAFSAGLRYHSNQPATGSGEASAGSL